MKRNISAGLAACVALLLCLSACAPTEPYITSDFKAYPVGTHRIAGVLNARSAVVYRPGSIELAVKRDGGWKEYADPAREGYVPSVLPDLRDGMRVDLDLQQFGDLEAGTYRAAVNARPSDAEDAAVIYCYFTVR